MPIALVVLTGYPASGKTSVGAQIASFIHSKGSGQVIIVQDEQNKAFNRDTTYLVAAKEKDHRAFLRSEVQKHLTNDTVVILDSLNYIKGYRYELYCAAKACKATYCVVHCDISAANARQFNASKPQDVRYTDEVLDALVMRFESPDSRNRWDHPLFVIHPADCPSTDALPIKDIYAVLMDQAHGLTPNQSTQSQPIAPTNFLHDLDRITQDIVKALMTAQGTAVPGDSIAVPHSTDRVHFRKPWSLPELNRTRRQFVTFAKTRPVEGADALGKMFVCFLNTANLS